MQLVLCDLSGMEEELDLVGEEIRLLDLDQMADLRDDLPPRAVDARLQDSGMGVDVGDVRGAGQDQGGDVDLGEAAQGGSVRRPALREGGGQRAGILRQQLAQARPGLGALGAGGIGEVGVLDPGRDQLLAALLLEHRPEVDQAAAQEVLGVGEPGDHGPHEHERLHPVRMGERVVHRQPGAVRAPHEDGAADLQALEDGMEIVDVGIRTLRKLGAAESAAVVADHPEALGRATRTGRPIRRSRRGRRGGR